LERHNPEAGDGRLFSSKWLNSRTVTRRELRDATGDTMADYRRAICVLFILLALLGVAGCCAPWTQPPFETAYSAVGAQVK
jgi:hypothetical protein